MESLDIYEKYALLDGQIKELEETKEAMRATIIAQMNESGVEKIEHVLGTFSTTPLKKWVYPEYVTEMNESFKAAKAKSESTGEATYTENLSLRFLPIKL